MSKINLCVIFGGKSTEHEVSCKSAASVIGNLDKNKYNIHIIKITKDGKWELESGEKAVISPSAGDGALKLGASGIERIPIDVAFPVLHGKNGEDGTVQGLLELAGIPYVGRGQTRRGDRRRTNGKGNRVSHVR